MPESNRLAVCNTPRERVIVSIVAAHAPMQAAAVMPKLPTQARPPMAASAPIKQIVTPSAAPEAVPSR